jgi:hypothetical protein
MRILRPDKMDARTEYRVRQQQRVSDSAPLSDRFPKLKSLSLDLGHYDSVGLSRTSQVKYTLNLKHARSVFRIDCSNPECVCGDFDLSEQIDDAVTERRQDVTGELRCVGWLSKTTVDQVRCGKILRYRLTLAYE